jgi:hypothetical protein
MSTDRGPFRAQALHQPQWAEAPLFHGVACSCSCFNSKTKAKSKAADRSVRSTRVVVLSGEQQVPHRAWRPVRNDKSRGALGRRNGRPILNSLDQELFYLGAEVSVLGVVLEFGNGVAQEHGGFVPVERYLQTG